MEAVSRAVVRFVLGAIFLFCSVVADVAVKGYFRKDGTYVAPHMRSSPNSTTLDNWSTRGNVNPYTGQAGTKNPVDGAVPSAGSLPSSGTVQSSSSYGESPSPSPSELKSETATTSSRRIEAGMGAASVKRILGLPKSISDDGTGETWRYSNGAWVEFTASGYVYKAGGFDEGSPKPNQEASSSDIDKLTQRIVQLEAKVADLTAQIEKRSPAANPTISADNQSPTDSDNNTPTSEQWRNIRSGQTMDWVLKTLGKPIRITNNGNGEVWKYSGGGWVEFFTSGRVYQYGGYSF